MLRLLSIVTLRKSETPKHRKLLYENVENTKCLKSVFTHVKLFHQTRVMEENFSVVPPRKILNGRQTERVDYI